MTTSRPVCCLSEVVPEACLAGKVATCALVPLPRQRPRCLLTQARPADIIAFQETKLAQRELERDLALVNGRWDTPPLLLHSLVVLRLSL